MVEFQAMLAMNSSKVSIGYGSRFAALVMTMCIRPCGDSGVSQEYALSMRSGLPSLSITRSSGRAGLPLGMRFSGVSAAKMIAGSFSGSVRMGMRRGYGARARKLPGPSSAPSSIWIRCSARQV